MICSVLLRTLTCRLFSSSTTNKLPRLRRIELVAEKLVQRSLYGGCHLDLTYLDTGVVTDGKKQLDEGVAAQKTIVIVHDVPGCAADSQPLISALAQRGARVLVLNFPGFGYGWGSQRKDLHLFTHATESKSALLMNFLNRLSIFRPDLIVGHGMGCLPAQHLCFHYPNKFRGCVFISHPGWQLPGHLKVFSERLTDFVATLWGAGIVARFFVRFPLIFELMLRYRKGGRMLLSGSTGGVAGWGLKSAVAALCTAANSEVKQSEEIAVTLCATGASYLLIHGAQDGRVQADAHLEMADALQIRQWTEFPNKWTPKMLTQPLRNAYLMPKSDHCPQANAETAEYLAEEMMNYVAQLRLAEKNKHF